MSRPHKTRLKLAAITATATIAVAACGSSSHSTSGASTGDNSGVITAPTVPSDSATLTVPKVTGTLSGPGVTATTITIGQITTISGPVPGLFQSANDGLDAFADFVNANGGLDGRQLKIVHEDDAFNCNTYTQDLTTLSHQVFAVVGNYSVEDTCGKSVLSADPSLLDIQGVMLDPTLYSLPNVFSPTPLPPGFVTTGYQYFRDRFANDITKTASLYPATSVATAKEQQLTAESIGYKYVYTRTLSPTDSDFTADILRMKNDGVKIVDMTSDSVTTDAHFAQEAAQQGFKPDAIMASSAYDSHFLQVLGDAADATNVYAPLTYSLFLGQDRPNDPGLDTFLTELDKVRPGSSATLYSVAAWGAGLLFAQAMAGAGSQVTPASAMAAISQITSFDAGGLISPSNPAKKLPSTCMVIASVRNGQWTRIDPATSGFECDGQYHAVSLSQIGS